MRGGRAGSGARGGGRRWGARGRFKGGGAGGAASGGRRPRREGVGDFRRWRDGIWDAHNDFIADVQAVVQLAVVQRQQGIYCDAVSLGNRVERLSCLDNHHDRAVGLRGHSDGCIQGGSWADGGRCADRAGLGLNDRCFRSRLCIA